MLAAAGLTPQLRSRVTSTNRNGKVQCPRNVHCVIPAHNAAPIRSPRTGDLSESLDPKMWAGDGPPTITDAFIDDLALDTKRIGCL